MYVRQFTNIFLHFRGLLIINIMWQRIVSVVFFMEIILFIIYATDTESVHENCFNLEGFDTNYIFCISIETSQ